MHPEHRPASKPPRAGPGPDREQRDRDGRWRRDRSRSRDKERGRDLPFSRAEEARRPPRIPSNPILAEAQRLARERLAAESKAGQAGGGTPVAARDDPPRRASWRVDDGEDGDGGGDSGQAERLGAKRKHQPIVWSGGTQPAQPARSLAGSSSAASIAQAEVEAFREQQALASGAEEPGLIDEVFFKPSPSVSSPEEEAHIRREGSARPLQVAMLESDAEGPFRPASRWGDPVVNGGGEGVIMHEVTSPSSPGSGRRSPPDEAGSSDGQEEGPRGSPCRGRGRPLAQASIAECRSVDLYEKLNRISEGTYGVVYRARNTETGEICALKKVKLDKERDGFPLTAIREINILLSLRHPNIVNVSEVVVGSSLDSVFMVMEFGDHDLAGVMRQRLRQPFSTAEVKSLMRELLEGVAYMHDNWVLHRDLKTSNILYTNEGRLKVCDFGLARQYGTPLKPYTHMVVTLWYRAPELLLGAKQYSTAVDVWSIGCIMGELLTREPLLPGKGEIDQLGKIFSLLGTPTEETWPGLAHLPNFRKFNFRQQRSSSLRTVFPPPGPVFDGRATLSEAGFDLLSSLLSLCPERRISAADALQHPWFREQPLPKDAALMPTFPSTAAASDRR